MVNQLLHSPKLEVSLELFSGNLRVKNLITNALAENEAYAADELVELAEEMLKQIAAVGIAHYLGHGDLHKEVYNDYLVQLFTSSGHDQNAGPMFRWAANMVKDCHVLKQSPLYDFFWEERLDESNGNGAIETTGLKLVLSRVNRLGELRNRVMHGFFVLPPEENRKEAEYLGELLIDAYEIGLWTIPLGQEVHFIQEDQFSGNFVLKDFSQWNRYAKAQTRFGQLALRIAEEQAPDFWAHEEKALEKTHSKELLAKLKKPVEALMNFVESRDQGAFAVWIHPHDTVDEACFAEISKGLVALPDTRIVAYGLHEHGISYTSDFLLRRLIMILDSEGKHAKSDKKLVDVLKIVRATTADRVVVLINRVHLALFSSQHITRIHNILFENRIFLVAVGHHYEYLNSFFNAYYKLEHSTGIPSADEVKAALRNYLRFKGPSHEKAEDRADVQILEEILQKLTTELSSGKEIYARRFADEFQYDIEFVHEIFAVLHPWLRSARKPFEEDQVDELYGFPSKMTEVTPIYLALGRRDIKLEYQHKTLSL
jgi:hypothetical protein